MNAMQKISLFELVVSSVALLLVLLLTPWFGEAAFAGFGVLGLLGFTPLMLKREGRDRVVSDERDHDIDVKARFIGIAAAWIFLFISLTAITMWLRFQDKDVPTRLVFAVLWIQFGLCYVVKGAVALKLYGGINHAA